MFLLFYMEVEMKIYVDTENINNSWIDVLKYLKASDTMHLFCSINTCKLDVQCVSEINSCMAKIVVHNCVTGTNAMDFQLCTFLGREVSRYPKSIHRIFSGDKGYKAVCCFWKNEGINVDYLSDRDFRTSKRGKAQLEVAKNVETGNSQFTINESIEEMSNMESSITEYSVLSEFFTSRECERIYTNGLSDLDLRKIALSMATEMCKLGYGNAAKNTELLIKAVTIDGFYDKQIQKFKNIRNAEKLRKIYSRYKTVAYKFYRR